MYYILLGFGSPYVRISHEGVKWGISPLNPIAEPHLRNMQVGFNDEIYIPDPLNPHVKSPHEGIQIHFTSA